jgi:hypothetical protein
MERKKKNIEGQSTEEIAKELRKNKESVRDFIKEAMAAGLCDYVGNKQAKAINGRSHPIPVYRFKMKTKKK